MLARKYYAGKGISKGKMNTNPVTQSSSTRARRLTRIRSPTPVSQVTQKRSASDKIEKVRKETVRCGSVQTSGIPKSSSCNKCVIMKEQTGKQASSEQIKNVSSKQICNLDEYWGSLKPSNNCAHT